MGQKQYNVYYTDLDGRVVDVLTTENQKTAVNVQNFLNKVCGDSFAPACISEITTDELFYPNPQYMTPFKLRLYHDTHGMSWEILKIEPSDLNQFAFCLTHGPYIDKALWMLNDAKDFANHDYIGYVLANNSESAAFILMRWIKYFESTGEFGSYNERNEIIEDFKYERVELKVRNLNGVADIFGYFVSRSVATMHGALVYLNGDPYIEDNTPVFICGHDKENNRLYVNAMNPEYILDNYAEIFVSCEDISEILSCDMDGDTVIIVSEAYNNEA